jgi:hypothetical protein
VKTGASLVVGSIEKLQIVTTKSSVYMALFRNAYIFPISV